MLYKCCYTCKHWQGIKDRSCGGCNRVVGTLMPKLFNETNIFGWHFEVPFDPHDIKYFEQGRGIMKLMKMVQLPEGVHRKVVRETDLRFILEMYNGEIVRDSKGRPSIKGEREALVDLVYFFTDKLMKGCEYYDQLAFHR